MVNKPKHYSLAKARSHLSKADPQMGALIKKVGATKVRSESELSVFQSLVRAIAYQMLSTKSAAAIYGRLVEQCKNTVTPKSVKKLGEDVLRDIGFSRAKVVSIMDLSQKMQSGAIPADDVLVTLTDQELVECLTVVKGIGVWSVEILMIFNLGRADVFPATDLGVRKGHMLACGLDEMLTAKQLLVESDAWRPYRTVAAWYLWRATDSVDWGAM